MLVEDHDRNKVVACLICKTGIRVGSGPAAPRRSQAPPKASRKEKPKYNE